VNETEKKFDPPIKVHQCLFGYHDGHRLLTTSFQLPEEEASLLLLLSDLAPGLSLPANGNYWTGISLPNIKSYALMRTWLAPELSRPGCVWTHVLIIAFSDIARFPNLSILREYFTRPSIAIGFELYAVPLLLPSPSGASPLDQVISSFDKAYAYRVIRSIYADHGTGKVNAQLGELDETIFAIWSQQWPQLRRTFSFRTATNSCENLFNITKRFDLAVLVGSDRNLVNPIDNNSDSIEEWEKTCIDDLLFSHHTELRRFLWRYGSDIRLGRKRFQFLVNIYLSTRSKNLNDKNLYKLLTNITKVLPSMDDGKVIKEDLVSSNQYSMLPSPDPIDMLTFYVNNAIASKLPILSADTFEAIQYNWSERSEEILSIAEIAAKSASELSINLLDRIATVTDASSLLASTSTKPNLRNKLLTLNPSLLDSDYLVNISSAELSKLIMYVPDDAYILIDRILHRLIKVDNLNIAEQLVQRFPDASIATVIVAIDLFFVGSGSRVPQSWVNAIKAHASKILNSDFIERAQTTSALSFFASMLDYIQPAIMQVGPIPWAKGIKNARDDLSGADRKNFLVFLLMLALHKPRAGCEPIFEIAFDSIYTDLKYSNLGYEKTSQLLHYLPNLGLFKNWDHCLRLKTGIVNAYVKYNLNPNSFKRLTTNTNLYNSLVELAEDSKAGRKFIKKITTTFMDSYS
jgi:hypothetical protein